MINSILKFKANVIEEKYLKQISYGKKINKDLLIAGNEKNHNMILFNLKLKKKILKISFHKSYITSIQLCTKPLIIDNKNGIFSEYSFYFLSSSFDKKYALHKILYKDLNNENITYKLIAQNQPTKDELNSVIQIENGQILVGARDQRVILFDNKIKNGKFQKLFEIKKKWPKEVKFLFEIKNNLIGVNWRYDDAEADTCIYDRMKFYKNHIYDGLYIYLVSNNKLIQKKFISFKGSLENNSYIVKDDKLILKLFDEIIVYELNNFEIMWKISDTNLIQSYIYPFNERYFILFGFRESKAKFILYNINTMKDVQTIEVLNNNNQNCYLFPISNNEYIFNNLIITINKE